MKQFWKNKLIALTISALITQVYSLTGDQYQRCWQDFCSQYQVQVDKMQSPEKENQQKQIKNFDFCIYNQPECSDSTKFQILLTVKGKALFNQYTLDNYPICSKKCQTQEIKDSVPLTLTKCQDSCFKNQENSSEEEPNEYTEDYYKKSNKTFLFEYYLLITIGVISFFCILLLITVCCIQKMRFKIQQRKQQLEEQRKKDEFQKKQVQSQEKLGRQSINSQTHLNAKSNDYQQQQQLQQNNMIMDPNIFMAQLYGNNNQIPPIPFNYQQNNFYQQQTNNSSGSAGPGDNTMTNGSIKQEKKNRLSNPTINQSGNNNSNNQQSKNFNNQIQAGSGSFSNSGNSNQFSGHQIPEQSQIPNKMMPSNDFHTQQQQQQQQQQYYQWLMLQQQQPQLFQQQQFLQYQQFMMQQQQLVHPNFNNNNNNNFRLFVPPNMMVIEEDPEEKDKQKNNNTATTNNTNTRSSIHSNNLGNLNNNLNLQSYTQQKQNMGIINTKSINQAANIVEESEMSQDLNMGESHQKQNIYESKVISIRIK